MATHRVKMFEPLREIGQWFSSITPSPARLKRPKISFNFIGVHYLYIVSMTLCISLVIWKGGTVPYIDALFFATGTTTQSGLNTIDVNKLELYVQIIIMMVANVCTPIFINTVVVFVRLHWFQKKFEHVVRLSREQRRSKAKTWGRTKTELQNASEPAELESGVNGRAITVLHATTKPNGMSGTTAHLEEARKEFAIKMGLNANTQSVSVTPESSNTSNRSNRSDDHDIATIVERPHSEEDNVHHLGLNPRLHREITFADEVPKSGHSRHNPKHVEFLERQKRNAKEGSAIRIPGPRDFERGELPKHLSDAEEHELNRLQTRNTDDEHSLGESRTRRKASEAGQDAGDDSSPGPGDTHLTFDEPERPNREKHDTLERSSSAGPSRFQQVRTGTNSLLRRRQNTTTNRGEGRISLARTFSNLVTIRSRHENEDPMPYFSWTATTGRNSAFVGLTGDQREELGGIEYRALKTLAAVLVLYYVGFHTLGMVVNLPWIMHTQPYKRIVQEAGANPGWWAVFTSASLFNDLGFTLTPDSLISFQNAILTLAFGSFLIIIGNTGFPCMLRFVIWVASKLVPHGSGLWEELRFLLDHPRRCFTLLFPSKATWWLFWILVLLNGVDLIFFIILDLNDETVTSLSPGIRVLVGWFQATSTRTAGFACVNLADLHPAVQVSYMIMMYISVFPIAISVRRTNVYEERSLGIWSGDEKASEDDTEPSYVGQHLRRQLSFDLWYVFLGFFIICIAEGSRLSNHEQYAFTMFSVLFEIVSAYGTVGLSLGYPGKNASFSTEFHPVSKLVIIAMMLRGRHRSLPYRLDRAILLPSENLQKKEAEEANRRHMNRMASMPAAVGTTTATSGDGVANGDTFPTVSTLKSGELDPDMAETPEQQGPRRRTSNMSQTKRERSRSLGRVIAGGLGAGPSISKHD